MDESYNIRIHDGFVTIQEVNHASVTYDLSSIKYQPRLMRRNIIGILEDYLEFIQDDKEGEKT